MAFSVGHHRGYSTGHHQRRREGLLYLLIISVVMLMTDFIFLSPDADADAAWPGETMTAITKPATDSATGTVR
jgi:hypothetical protein